jgi:hypothetical protein
MSSSDAGAAGTDAATGTAFEAVGGMGINDIPAVVWDEAPDGALGACGTDVSCAAAATGAIARAGE